MTSKVIKDCVVCGKTLYPLLDLGNQPLANSYTDTQYEPQDVYPLYLCRCKGCFHLQINCVIDPSVLFKDYIYTSGTSQTGRAYFDSFAKRVSNALECKGEFKVLDIACNDGTQLDSFKKLGCDREFITVGVDPAENLKGIVLNKGHDIYSSFFTESVTDLLVKDYDSFDIIIAQNVFAHVESPCDFLKQCSRLMRKDTRLYIQTSQAKMIQNNEFDTVYHEHISFFNTNSMKTLCNRIGLYLNNVTFQDIHGTSYLFEISKLKSVEKYIITDSELYNEDTDRLYTEYVRKCIEFKTTFKDILHQYKSKGYDIIGYGSTAKSNTMLNYCGLNTNVFRYIIDENALKHKKYTPGGSIPIVSLDCFKSGECRDKKTLIVVLAWNYFDEIFKKIKETKIVTEVLNINPLKLVTSLV